jgi:hypothetical protein
MKYKRQLMSGMFALALLASGTSVFAADIPVTGSKMVQQTHQVKMKSGTSNDGIIDAKDANGKDLETKDDTVKKVSTKKAKKVRTHVKTTKPITTTKSLQ